MTNMFKVGIIGETFLMFELAKKGLFSQKQNSLFDYDILVENDARIEVKTSTIHIEKSRKGINSIEYQRKYWFFTNQNGRKRRCDFYALIGLNEKNIPKKIFIVPEKDIDTREAISIPVEFKQKSYNGFSLKDYENKFELISNFKRE